ncbi:hypothetical protein, partial [Mesorhizobium sp. M7A.F.Ca.US.002.01.1.1]|uniref:hypothetical protein n=1 Tax=Mesorhizobium sp. M7A.F.Ca.US.002.01.1.1 TaxID=2496700 RepID=UPI0019D42821
MRLLGEVGELLAVIATGFTCLTTGAIGGAHTFPLTRAGRAPSYEEAGPCRVMSRSPGLSLFGLAVRAVAGT